MWHQISYSIRFPAVPLQCNGDNVPLFGRGPPLAVLSILQAISCNGSLRVAFSFVGLHVYWIGLEMCFRPCVFWIKSFSWISCFYVSSQFSMSQFNSLAPGDAIWWQIWVNIGSGNGLLPDGTKPLPEPVLTKVLWNSFDDCFSTDSVAINHWN